jgi:GT2 family glycosyltransferase
MNKPKLSIVILSYNTRELLVDCLDSLKKVKGEINYEIIVVDNGSVDGSVAAARNFESQIPDSKLKIVENKKNLGFAAGNNRAKKLCRGRYILFLNSDTLVYKNTLLETVKYLDKYKGVGALTCKIKLPSGELDRDARRAFITPWIGLVHVFLKLDRFFPKSKLLAKYWYGYISPNKTHEVDVIQGAYFLSRKRVLDKVGWFDEDYFLDGEDIDLCWRIKKAGWKIIYYPKVSILHLKGATKGKRESLSSIKKVSFREKVKYRMAGVNSMEIFVRKRLWTEYSLPVMLFVLLGIKMLKVMRILNLLIFDSFE